MKFNKRAISLVLISLILIIGISALAPTASTQTDQKIPVLIGFKGDNDVAFVRSHGGDVRDSFTSIGTVVASVPVRELDALRRNPNVAYVEEDALVYALAQSTPWGVTKIQAPVVWAGGNKGTSIKVAVLDSGIDTSHPDLNIAGGATFVAGTSSYNDDNGHGTHCAGIVAALDNSVGVVGVAPEVSLYAVKVLDRTGSGSISNIINGMEWCINNGIQVISMSFGSSSDSASLHAECDKAYNTGIVLVAAAGNSGPGSNTVGYPARYSSVIAVAATDSNDNVASFSSRGTQLSVAAPGVSVYSTYKGAAYATMSGTSMACPHTAGTAALILRNAPHTPAEVRTILQTTAVDLGTPGLDTNYGYGRINASKAAGAQLQPPTPDFSMTVSPSLLTIQSGTSGSFTTTLTSLNSFMGTVTLTTTAPAGWTAIPNPTSRTLTSGGSATSTVTVTAPAGAGSGTYPVSVRGTSGSITHLATITVNVQSAPTAPSAPQNLRATAGNGQVSLSWSAPSSSGGSAITGYKAYRGIAAGSETLLTTLGNVLVYNDAAVTNGVTYFYRVTAVNSVGESVPSNEASATPAASQQGTMRVTVTLSRTYISRGSTITITVIATDAGTSIGISGASVTMKVIYPSGQGAGTSVGTTDSSGRVRFTYRTGFTAPRGTYTVTATVTKAGYQTGTGRGTFRVT
ncbi:MAG: S8 family serine peptidase [Candidatus Bathyarchaeia archaeon]